jgi:hypothetical protein
MVRANEERHQRQPDRDPAASAEKKKSTGMARVELSQAFISDFLADWRQHGKKAIAQLCRMMPDKYAALAAKVIEVQRVEIGNAGTCRVNGRRHDHHHRSHTLPPPAGLNTCVPAGSLSGCHACDLCG